MFKKALLLGALTAMLDLTQALGKDAKKLDPSLAPVIKKTPATEAEAQAAKKKSDDVIPRLKGLRPGGKYKIVQFTDLHLGENEYAD